MAEVTEIVTKFSFTGNLGKLDKFNSGLATGIVSLGKFTLFIKGAQVAINAFTLSTMGTLVPLVGLADKTGVAIEKIQALEYANLKAGGSSDELKNSLSGLSQKIADAGLRGSEDFARIGISVRDVSGRLKTADTVLLEVGQRLRGINSASQRANIASKLGIDAGTLGLITKSRQEISEFTSEAETLGLVSSQQAKGVLEFNSSITTLKFSLSAIQNQLAIALAPELRDLAEWFKLILKNNREWISDGLKTLVKWISTISKMISRLLSFVWDLSVAFAGNEKAAMLLIGAIALFLSPISAMTLAIAGALLILDDLIVAFYGGKSIIRDFFLEFFGFDIQPLLQGIVDTVKHIFSVLHEMCADFFEGIVSVFSGLGKLLKGDFLGAFDDIGHGITKIFMAIPNAIMNYFKPIFTWIKNSIKNLLPDWAKWVLGRMGVSFDSDDDEGNFSAEEAEQNKTTFESQSLTPNNTINNTNQSTKQTVNNNINIEVKSSDPQMAGTIVADNLKHELKDARNQFSAMGDS